MACAPSACDSLHGTRPATHGRAHTGLMSASAQLLASFQGLPATFQAASQSEAILAGERPTVWVAVAVRLFIQTHIYVFIIL